MCEHQMKEGHGSHHPYCKHTYEEIHWIEWKCICDILNQYDKWRRDAKGKGKKSSVS